jgi:asparagine synthase (glutamine-hydrolysing)
VDGWFNDTYAGKLPEMLLDSNSLIYGLLQPAPVQALLRDHQSGRQDNHKLLFSLVMVEQWLRGIRSAADPITASA